MAPGDHERTHLASLFARIDTDFFRPHDMTAEGAKSVARHAGKDVYLLGWEGADAVAYGILRGWQEGFAVPSLGIAVRSDQWGRGLGRVMMRALHSIARSRGAAQVRLRVAPGNQRARELYASLGYREIGEERGERLMLLDLYLVIQVVTETAEPPVRLTR